MKYIKYYETVNFKPKLYDYAIFNVIRDTKKIKVIGQIIKINFDNTHPYTIEIKQPYFISTFKLENIECWSDSKEELELILTLNKYNL